LETTGEPKQEQSSKDGTNPPRWIRPPASNDEAEQKAAKNGSGDTQQDPS